jgi:hypothetical protein
MRLAAVVLMFAFAAAGCGSAKDLGPQSCQEYYELNVAGISPASQAFCLTQGSKTAGNCCVGDNQCISKVCCGWGQTTCPAPRLSCECVGP